MKLEQFNSLLEEDLGWRKAEVVTLILHAESTGLEVLNKSVILLLYAHWEGYIKKGCKLYLRYLSEKKLRVGQLSNNLQAIFFKNIVRQCIETSDSMTLQHEINIINKWSTAQDVKFRLHDNEYNSDFEKNYIDTQANLSPKIFKNILDIVGLNYNKEYELKAPYINDRLLKNRNAIGHGSKIQDSYDTEFILTIEEIKKMRDVIFSMIDATKEELIFFCEYELYLDEHKEKRTKYFSQREDEISLVFKNIEEKYEV